MKIIEIHQKDPNYPSVLKRYLDGSALAKITAIGNTNILRNKTVAIFSSIKCPCDVIIKTYDLMKQLKINRGTATI